MVVFEPRELDNLPSANWKVEEGIPRHLDHSRSL